MIWKIRWHLHVHSTGTIVVAWLPSSSLAAWAAFDWEFINFCRKLGVQCISLCWVICFSFAVLVWFLFVLVGIVETCFWSLDTVPLKLEIWLAMFRTYGVVTYLQGLRNCSRSFRSVMFKTCYQRLCSERGSFTETFFGFVTSTKSKARRSSPDTVILSKNSLRSG